MPFVLFEPRKSADLYLGNQPFFGAKAVATRHLVLQKLNMDTRPVSASVVLASDLIESDDMSHIWLLRVDNVKSKNTWVSEKLIDKKLPDILLSGSDYERNFGERDVDLAAEKKAMFSFMRNGSATLYLPAGSQGALMVTLEPRGEKDYGMMLKEIMRRLNMGEMGGHVDVETDGKFIRLKSAVIAENQPSLKLIARYSGEFWLNVKLNGKDL
jgi:hypothetical protein